MNKLYEPNLVEPDILKFWSDNYYFNDVNKASEKKFSLILPPPNESGCLHLGHALNNTMQDILVRIKRMEGYDIMWIPGTDHGGLGTQNVVERKLIKEGKDKRNMTKSELIKEIWNYTDEYGNIIINQLKLLGLSCNWDKLRFTLDEDYVKLVQNTFVEMYKKGLIYRGNYMNNWCNRCRTVLSDDEVNVDKKKGYLYYIKYFLIDKNGNQDNQYITVATTRPETLFGDSGVGVNCNDKRYKEYYGMQCLVPIVNRKVPIIADLSISKDFGTGAMKITPAHDKTDFQLGSKYQLDIINAIDQYNKFPNLQVKEFNGNLANIRQTVVKYLEDNDLLVKKEICECINKICYRCTNDIENRISDQWYVKMRPLADKIQNIDCNFYPKHQKDVFLNWLDNINDWCISRQISWGHEMPVWYCKICNHINVSVEKISNCQKCNNDKLAKETDVLDTWFSSWLYSFGVFKNEDINKYFPLDVVISGSDILFFWVTKMIMASMEFKDTVPFKDIYLHDLIRDKDGKKMSKSLGNIIDPLEIIQKFGTDALRFSLIFVQSSKLHPNIFQTGKSFITKIWNAARYIIMKSKEVIEPAFPLDISLKYQDEIIIKLGIITEKIRTFIDTYELNAFARLIYSFTREDFCSKYLEKTKNDKSLESYKSLYSVYIKILIILHPLMPFITERIYQEFKTINMINYDFKKSIMIEKFY